MGGEGNKEDGVVMKNGANMDDQVETGSRDGEKVRKYGLGK